MPNVGKPSKGCAHCRERKLKCDLERPSCTQCIRTGRKCHGYRDPLSMMFKNESTVVIDRAQKTYEALLKQRKERKQASRTVPVHELASEKSSNGPSPSSSTSSSSQHTSTSTRSDSLARPLAPPVENQALSFFAANNILQAGIVGRGDYRWLFHMLNDPETDATLRSSAHAASLATLATANKSPVLMKRAQEHYANALSLTNKALGDSNKVRKDSTVVSVMLLGVYETFVFEKHSMGAWMQHLKGAEMLFALRGESQFENDLARQIFVQFYRTTIAKGIELGTPVPDKIARLYRFLTSMKDYTMHGVEHQVEILEKAIALMQDEDRDPALIVSDAMKLDEGLDFLTFLIQTLWRYETVRLEKPVEHVFGNVYHIYTNAWVISMWNIHRLARIRLYQLVQASVNKGLRCTPPRFSDEEAQTYLNTCKDVIGSQMLDICASTPQITGQIAFPHQVKRNVDVLSEGIKAVNLRNDMFKLHAQGTYLEPFKSTGLDHLIGPLYEIGRSHYGPRLTRWAVDQLYFIARTIGTRQAIMLAEELEEKLETESNFMTWNDPCPTSRMLIELAQ